MVQVKFEQIIIKNKDFCNNINDRIQKNQLTE